MTSRSDWYPHYHGARTLLGPRKGPAGPLPPTFQRGPITASLSWRVLRRASHATTGKKCIWKTKTSRKRWLTPLHACIGLRERWPDPVPRTSLLSLSLSFSARSFLLFSLRTHLVSLLYALRARTCANCCLVIRCALLFLLLLLLLLLLFFFPLNLPLLRTPVSFDSLSIDISVHFLLFCLFLLTGSFKDVYVASICM